MNGYILQDNDLIKEIDRKAKSPEEPRDLKNSFKTIKKSYPVTNYGTKTLYSRRFNFDLSRQHDNLAQLYIKCTMGNGQVASTVETSFATRIFKRIVLKTKSGTILQTITPQYSHSRLDEMFGSKLYEQIIAGVEPSGTFLANPAVTCFVPLFFFFSEDTTTFLNTRDLEPLELECLVNDTKESMGLSADITSASYELYSMYFDTNEGNKNSEHINTIKPGVIRTLKSTFDLFEEDTVLCPAGSTSARLLLRCPHPLFVINMALINSTSQIHQISSFILESANVTFAEVDYRMNYSMSADNQSFMPYGTTCYWFSKEKKRVSDSGLLTFSGSFFPCYLTVYFSALGVDHTLHVFEEHRTKFQVSNKGVIHLNTGASLMDQSNSALA